MFVLQGLSVSNGNLDLHSGFDGDGSDLLDNLGGRVQVNHTLVDAHLETIPGLGTFTTRSLTCGNPEDLGRHPDGSFYFEVFVLGSLDKIGTDLFEALDVSGGQSDPDTMDRAFFGSGLRVLVHRL